MSERQYAIWDSVRSLCDTSHCYVIASLYVFLAFNSLLAHNFFLNSNRTNKLWMAGIVGIISMKLLDFFSFRELKFDSCDFFLAPLWPKLSGLTAWAVVCCRHLSTFA